MPTRQLGAGPAAEKAERRKALTVGGLTEAFTAEHVKGKLKETTADSYVSGLDRLQEAHDSLKAEALTRAQLSTAASFPGFSPMSSLNASGP